MSVIANHVPVVLSRYDLDHGSVTAPEGCDLVEFSEFLESHSVCGVDYHPSDYVEYLRDRAEQIDDGSRRWSDEDLAAARDMFSESVAAIATRHGDEVLTWYRDVLADAEESSDLETMEDLTDDLEFLDAVGFFDLAG